MIGKIWRYRNVREYIMSILAIDNQRQYRHAMLIFLSEYFMILNKVIYMFTSPFYLHLVIIVMRNKNVFWFRCLRQRLRACDVARILVALFVQIPVAFIWETGRYISETAQVIVWFYIGHDLVILQNIVT